MKAGVFISPKKSILPLHAPNRKQSKPKVFVQLQAAMQGSSSLLTLKDLVLVGGGHSHIEVLRSFGMMPMPGVHVTLVTKDMHTPYSGMLPGYVSGFYDFDECHIDLARLACFAGATLIHASACGLDTLSKYVMLDGRPPIRYDVLSLDIGITPRQSVPGAAKHTTAVKPISSFLERLEQSLAQLRQPAVSGQQRAATMAVVGGGAGGVELAAALQHRLRREHSAAAAAGPEAGAGARVVLLSRANILAGSAPGARERCLRLLKERGVEVREGTSVESVEAGVLQLQGGGAQPFDACLWCTEASPAPWLASTGLPTDPQGFLAVNEFLQSAEGPPDVFAAGDCAACLPHPRPKAGVFAVRQGMPLAANLRRRLEGRALVPFRPQSDFLSIVGMGDEYAVAMRGGIALEGAWLWRLKHWIDKKFMHKYGRDLPFAMAGDRGEAASPVAAASGPEAMAALAAAKMRCGGCGSKVGQSVLERALRRIPKTLKAGDPHIVVGLDSPDDAAVVRPPPAGHLMVQTVDFFRSFVQDDYVFGAITANHALGDCHAMGAQPHTALAVAVVPWGLEAVVEERLVQLLSGAAGVLAAAGCGLVGGHTCEGAEVALGFCIYGSVPEGEMLRKAGLAAGQALLLTKPLGTGAIMAAAMRGAAKGRWVAGALESAQQSNAAAVTPLRRAGASACTDVTGFGLLGHLAEMARASQVGVRVSMETVPWLPGARECVEAGILSSAHPQNSRAAAVVANADSAARHPCWPLLLDPQTGGGLLAGVPWGVADTCVAELRSAGFPAAAVIGRVLPSAEQLPDGAFVEVALDRS